MKKYFLLCVAAVLLALTVTPTIVLADGNPEGGPPHSNSNILHPSR